MSLQKIKSNPGARKKRKVVGRGNGSGHGTYSTRGGKGQTARSGGGVKPGFEGGQTPLHRRFPKFRGFTNPSYVDFQIVNVSDLEIFADGEKITVKELAEKLLVSSTKKPVKLLGDGEITKKLHVEVEKASKSAVEKIEKVKGSVKQLTSKKEEPTKEKKS